MTSGFMSQEDYVNLDQKFLASQGRIFLTDDFELWLLKVFSNSKQQDGMSGSYSISSDVAFEYADQYGENRLQTLELLNSIVGDINAFKQTQSDGDTS